MSADRILIVDDEPQILRFLKPALTAAGYDIIEASTGTEALSMASTRSPDLIILDEAVSALDVSVKAQIINLLSDLQDDLGLSLLFISHDLAVVEHLAHRVAVMYLGKIVELTDRRTLFAKSHHPYTRALFASKPTLDPDRRTTELPLSGDPPNPINPPSGCRFRTRCSFAQAICAEQVPVLQEPLYGEGIGDSPHLVACHLPEAQAAMGVHHA